MSNWEETTGMTQDTGETTSLGWPSNPPIEEVAVDVVERDVWGYLLKLLPISDPTPQQTNKQVGRWMGGWMKMDGRKEK